jgi:hypothetical protein
MNCRKSTIYEDNMDLRLSCKQFYVGTKAHFFRMKAVTVFLFVEMKAGLNKAKLLKGCLVQRRWQPDQSFGC